MSGAFGNGSEPRATPVHAPAMVWGYAGFWWRVLAFLLDMLVLAVLDELVILLTGMRQFGIAFDGDDAAAHDGPFSTIDYSVTVTQAPHLHWHTHGNSFALLSFALTAGYFILLESSRWQATLGKRICGMRVTDLHGRRIGLGRAVGRYAGKYVSWLIFCIGFLMAGWTRRKQALHDLMASTLVMRRHEADPVFVMNPP
ncbi:RDD family protein [Acetobacteraceae bacterium KSS8]|uniref:RDD family protein n=1 Tax=Endosaccharibacter trunci TaxID=2812733 RepID=A0ABT1W803_9PROT|nr:RDD family protein [Acetobacteraceae bacterium KSS8]